MQRLRSWFGLPSSPAKTRTSKRAARRRSRFETLERREVFNATPMPVLMVIADSQHFYYQEYGDTRASLESLGLDVVVAAATRNASTPHADSGEPADGGVVMPDIALGDVKASDYSAIVFVGGWGSSSYQYAFEGTYANSAYNGDLATKEVVNDLIGDFVAEDKYVAAICHGTTILAWARVDGQSPLEGKQVSTPFIGSPAVNYNGVDYANFALMQYDQMIVNGAIPNLVSGQYGDPNTVADDVVVDGKIITGENYDSAAVFGHVIGTQVIAQANVQPEPLPENAAPVITDSVFTLAENTGAGTVVGNVIAADSDAGQSHSYAIVGGNDAGAFAINAATGQIVVANAAALDFETSPLFKLQVQVTDSGLPAKSAAGTVIVNLLDVAEAPAVPVPGFALVDGNLRVQGTAGNDSFYIWVDYQGQTFAWMNGLQSGPHRLADGGRVIVYGGDGNDRIYATDSSTPVHIYGEAGHDLITGGSADDVLDGGAGWDRIWGNAGNDLIVGGDGNDTLDGREGDDVIVGGAGDDQIYGHVGHDVLIGGLGSDRVDGGAGDDLLIGGATDFDTNSASLLSLLTDWAQPIAISERIAYLHTGNANGVSLSSSTTVHDDDARDAIFGGLGDDWMFAGSHDQVYGLSPSDKVAS